MLVGQGMPPWLLPVSNQEWTSSPLLPGPGPTPCPSVLEQTKVMGRTKARSPLMGSCALQGLAGGTSEQGPYLPVSGPPVSADRVHIPCPLPWDTAERWLGPWLGFCMCPVGALGSRFGSHEFLGSAPSAPAAP